MEKRKYEYVTEIDSTLQRDELASWCQTGKRAFKYLLQDAWGNHHVWEKFLI